LAVVTARRLVRGFGSDGIARDEIVVLVVVVAFCVTICGAAVVHDGPL
jgi:hypothetical protein